MKVLAKYDMARPDRCIYVSSGYGDYREFCFREGDARIALRPKQDCRSQPMLIEGDNDAAVTAFLATEKEQKTATAKREDDFRALIWNTPTFNGLAAVWPAIEELREAIVGSGSSLSILSEDVVNRIKADAAFTAVAA